jgi:phage terminase small subunit
MPKHVYDVNSEGLTARELVFVQHKLVGEDGTAAAIAAKYKQPAHASVRLMKLPRIQAALAKRAAKASAKAQVTREEVEQFLATMMRGKQPKVNATHKLQAAQQLAKLNAWDKAPSSVAIPVIGIKIET